MRGLTIGLCGVAVVILAEVPVRGDVLDNFEGGTNYGQWFGTINTTVEPTGGNPGGWLHALENMGEPLFQFEHDPNNVFSGDYVARGVTHLTVDLRTDAGFYSETPDGTHVTVRLYWTNNGNYVNGIEAYVSGAVWPVIGAGWTPYSFPVPAASPTIPPGWSVWKGNGTPGTNLDWQYLVRHVDEVQIIYGEIGYAFPIRAWNIGMDNVRLVTDAAVGLPRAAR